MKLFTKEIDKKLFAQYPKGAEMEDQMVVAKIFNPYGKGTWYIMNSDPEDPNYLWGIVDLFAVEMGSISRDDLESVKVPPFNLPLERDLSFRPIKAKELWNKLQKEERQYTHGGAIPGGSGWGKFKKGERVLKMNDIKPGKPYLTYSAQHDAKNVVVRLPETTYMFSPGFMILGYVKPDKLTSPRLPGTDIPQKVFEFELGDQFQNYNIYKIKGYDYKSNKDIFGREISPYYKPQKVKKNDKRTNKFRKGGMIRDVKIDIIPSPQVREYMMVGGSQSDFATELQKNKSVIVDVSYETKTSYNISIQIGTNRFGINSFEFPGIKYLHREEFNYFDYGTRQKYYPKLKSISQLEEQVVKTLEETMPNLNLDVLTLKIYNTDAIQNIMKKSGEKMREGGAVKGRNNKTGETYGVVIGSMRIEDDQKLIDIRKSYSARISEYELRFDENNNLVGYTDYGYTLDGTTPSRGLGYGKGVYAENKKETIDAMTKLFNKSFANRVYDLISNRTSYEEGGALTSDKLTRDQYNFLTSEIEYTRKPYNEEDVYTSQDFMDLPDDIRTAIFNMKKIIVKDDEELSLFKSRLDGDTQFYVLYIHQVPYLVDTQGYNYARYLTRLDDYDGELDPTYADYVDEKSYDVGGYVLSDGSTTVEVKRYADEPTKFSEGRVLEGERPYGWGSKTYQTYLTGDEIAGWLSKDYDTNFYVVRSLKRGGLTAPTIGFKTDAMRESEDRDIKEYRKQEKVDNNTAIVGGIAGLLLGIFLNR